MGILIGIILAYGIYLLLIKSGHVPFFEYEIHKFDEGYAVFGKASLSPFLYRTHLNYFESVEDAEEFANTL